ncbi:unnamed protein product, partial [Prorocentrum cordatum]
RPLSGLLPASAAGRSLRSFFPDQSAVPSPILSNAVYMLTKQLAQSRVQMRLMMCQIKHMAKRNRDMRGRMEHLQQAAAEGIQIDNRNAARGEAAIQVANDGSG